METKQSTKKQNINIIIGVVSLLFIGFVGWFISGGLTSKTNATTNNINVSPIKTDVLVDKVDKVDEVGKVDNYYDFQNEIISSKGLHWHSQLSIFIKGEKQNIPSDIGLGATHNPIHTHDDTGEVHMEMTDVVRNKDLKLGNFFNVWEKVFNKNCIFEYCNSEDKKVSMLVNGVDNQEFENYLMQEKDKIEIRFE